MAFPCGVESFIEACSGAAITFTFWKFSHDPALLAFIGSINLAFNFLVAPLAAWQSDRIWTRWGRRIPFMLIGWSILILALIAMPLAPSLWILLAVVILYHAAVDIGFTGPLTPLYFEIVPKSQRGRAIVIKRLVTISAQVLFNLVLIGRFDDIYHLLVPLSAAGLRLTITGEEIIYWLAGVLVLVSIVMVLGCIRETRPATVRIEPFSPARYCRSMADSRRHWPLLLLAFSSVALGACLGQLQPLLITQQFGYSKQALGNMFAIALVAEIVIALPLLGFLADRFNRLRIYQVTIAVAAIFPLLFWAFIKFIAPHQIPSPHQIVLFMVGHSLVRTVAMLTVEPLYFDYVHPNDMGQMYSGLLVVRGVGGVLVLNGVGWWVKLYSSFFPLGGSMRYDYTSAYLYIALFAVIALGATLFYAAKIHAPQTNDQGQPVQGISADSHETSRPTSRPMDGGCALCPHSPKM